jgi:hypothetical protein
MIVITTTVNTRTNNNRPDTDLYADMPPQGRGRSGRTRPRTDEQGEQTTATPTSPRRDGPLRPDPTRGRRGGRRGEPTTTLPPKGEQTRASQRPTNSNISNINTNNNIMAPAPSQPGSIPRRPSPEASPPEPRSSTAPNNHLDTPTTPLRCAWRCDRIGQRRTRRRFETARRCPGL